MTLAASSCAIAQLISPSHRLITVVGAGGKTSLINWLGMQILPPEKRVIITSTTKIFPRHNVCTILNDGQPDFIDRIEQALDRHRKVVVAQQLDTRSGKLIGLSPAFVTHLRNRNIADTILVEADGAAHKPLKAPAEHEPVIPLESDLCIGVMGLDAMYLPLTEANVHRHEIFSHITKLLPGEPITPKQMLDIAVAPNGLFKGSPATSKLAVVLNKTDIPGGGYRVQEIERILPQEQRTRNYAWFTGSILNGQLHRIDAGPPIMTEPINNRPECFHRI
ncbi:putative selenium-dependent hydroxylase accessory protein YqeC [Pseudodesulfovibrio profundus]|uniref:Putative selenium-dependent hydroxylase accessory protein YqeC n=1 Tax=Pseudodesulfovibrio profundus TaxID=57320 RepID=A0A2C8F6B4_9BACT|nr:selenium cofactor biosynthesis protein YqeC [Pseudodesulfovibrio profundus]SOB57916.1 putative selenium-dependent hydroxylase accessory protein YqeC [Pseudodesulfovibrio profundus]